MALKLFKYLFIVIIYLIYFLYISYILRNKFIAYMTKQAYVVIY